MDEPSSEIRTRAYQQEMLDESLRRNVIIALDTGSGKTHIAVLRLRIEVDQEPTKVSWFLAPTVALCQQQLRVIKQSLPVQVGIISGASEPNQWKDAALWKGALSTHRVMVSTPQVLLDALRHGYIHLGRDISLLVFDEAHHAVENNPYNRIMMEFYFLLPIRTTGAGSIVRPMILGLTASPIYGGDIVKSFREIESNLDSAICTPRDSQNRAELAHHVHRPELKSVTYRHNPDSFSTNLATIEAVIRAINIDDDPYVISLRHQLSKAVPGSDVHRQTDLKLSKAIHYNKTYSHNSLNSFLRSASEIFRELGVWATDWYIWEVTKRAKDPSETSGMMLHAWKHKDKAYLLSIINKMQVVEPSYDPDDIMDDLSDKFQVLIKCLLREKQEAESCNESYSGLIFVQRRDVVLALAQLLSHHPETKDLFKVGSLLGTSETSQRHTFLDITSKVLREPQENTLRDFKLGDKNLIISTSVAEEGIDVQACGSVIRWDAPPNVVSWAQSRGRARKKKSTFTLMILENDVAQINQIADWQNIERQIIEGYTHHTRTAADHPGIEDDEDNGHPGFRIPETGALLTLQSAIPHLAHFCAVLPNTGNLDFRPIYEPDPPEIPLGWHSIEPRMEITPQLGPFGSTVTLPRLLPVHLRRFTVDREYPSKHSAHRHVAYKAYLALYEAGLVDSHFLPLADRDEEVEALKKEVEKRKGLAHVSVQMNPWVSEDQSVWFSSELTIEGLPPLQLLTRTRPTPWLLGEGPSLHVPRTSPIKVSLRSLGQIFSTDPKLDEARQWTRHLFWASNGSRMKWAELNFSYLFLPLHPVEDIWTSRRAFLDQLSPDRAAEDRVIMNAEVFGSEFGYSADICMVRDGFKFAKNYRFVRWRYDPLSQEEEESVQRRYQKRLKGEAAIIIYPVLVAEALPPRTNFLRPVPEPESPTPVKQVLFLREHSSILLMSPNEMAYSSLLPSVLRSMEMNMTVHSMRETLFHDSPALSAIPIRLLVTACTAPASQEALNYQRMETLGDTVLKYVVAIQLLAQYPLWHEGYLSRKKDHAVSNVKLAHENMGRGLYRWIIRDMLMGKKWKPSYESSIPVVSDESDDAPKSKKKKKKKQELSTKVLADVVESIIGAAFLHGGYNTGYECIKFFDLGLVWLPLDVRIDQILSRVEEPEDIPLQVERVEKILGYTFSRKLLLIEALTHASSQQNHGTISYERLEFLGDAVWDMIVTDYLYRAPGKYSPGHMFLRKSAMVNQHMLAFICLRSRIVLEAKMPGPDSSGNIVVVDEQHPVYLWQCMLHSSHRILEEQTATFARFEKFQEEITTRLEKETMFPWAALTRLHAPKFFSDLVESLVGAVFLDSGGNLDVVRVVLRQLGLLQILERIALDEADALHPVSRLSLYAQKHDKKLEYKKEQVRGNVSCVVAIDGKEIEETRTTEIYTGKISQEGVRFAAAEAAVAALHLWTVDVNAKKVKSKPRPKKKRKIEE
ncbi:hypothetical protein C8J56DRAFT_832913 [Mycena floridula]|nr:hypothetical protein C8J56DRAFT_832913 [Mycena floridula]